MARTGDGRALRSRRWDLPWSDVVQVGPGEELPPHAVLQRKFSARRFLGVLAENRRLAELPRMIRAFRDIAAAQRGEVSADVISAHPLTEDQLSTLKAKLTAREGRTVKLTSSVDPDMLGGLIVTIGSKRIDGSIRTRLNALTQAMKG